MKIAILECDEPLEELQSEYGQYTDYFARLLRAANPSVADKLVFTTFKAYKGEPLPTSTRQLEEFDGCLLTGSKTSAYEPVEWIKALEDFVRLAYGEIPIAAICFGHQVVAQALGGSVAKNPKGWEIAVTALDTFDCPLMPEYQGTLRLQQMHQDIVTIAPPGPRVVGSNAICDIQALYEPKRLFSVQGHPEFNEKTVKLLVEKRVAQGIVPEAYGKDAWNRAGDEHDGLAVGRAILRLFKE
ncbi:class I glutamine amidotransferase-like protein [Protomyces lactucae-debilis]|uniref:Class I glutamine amidotransferase-like protein n=1 Tax=Protomyces lactucae-debilis TaxID=2754530 RepID=A0A1Y2EWR0_PROLT|nr:class I glutamine amidotransferase-like protein [Protomyces lactucae-debilis]ORY76051.1 class I glutamine amidotransferase-like protein [Protomyces lactucae-debilis]